MSVAAHHLVVRSILLGSTLALAVPALAKPDTRVRDEIAEQYKWDLSDMYADWDAWEADLAVLKEKMDAFVDLKGTLAGSGEAVLAAMTLQDELEMVAYRAYSYPGLMATQDTRDNDVQARQQRVMLLFAEFQAATAWLAPELLAVPWETMAGWLDSTEGLAVYRFRIEELYRLQEHVLDEDGERLLAYGGPFDATPRQIYSMLSTADVEFPTVTLADGTEVEATHGNYETSRYSYRDQADREAMFKAHFSTFDDFENTYAAIYNATLQRDWAQAQSRNYDSTLDAALDDDAVPTEVYENLIAAAKDGAGPLQRYHQLRKDTLGVERYRYFDGYLPLVEEEWTFEYDDVQPMIVESVELFGDEYQATVQASFDDRWIDVYEAEGKRSGAFSWGVYGVHPYMLLNHGDTLGDAFTVAHEMGHTMHSVRSMEAQPYATWDYSIFVAEVASMTNENLFLDYLLEETDDPEKRIILLQRAIDDIASGFYRQAMFADYELRAHRAVEEGQPITAEVLQQLYLETLHDFFGDSLDDQEWYANTWARIPHFYNSPYYVYQYATSKAAASLLHERMTTGKKKDRRAATAAYLELLSAGGSDHPIDLLTTAGVDMTSSEPVDALVGKMDLLVTQLEVELGKL